MMKTVGEYVKFVQSQKKKKKKKKWLQKNVIEVVPTPLQLTLTN